MSVQTSYTELPVTGLEGQLHDSGPNDVIGMINNDSASMPFGHGVVFEAGSVDQGALMPDAISEVVAGIVVHSHAYAQSDLDATGVIAGAMVNVIRKGRINVICGDAAGCAPGDRLHIRALGGTEGELLANADGVNTIDSTGQGVWLTTAAQGELAVLEVDFTNLPA